MSQPTRFLRDERGSLVEKVALLSAMLAVASVLGAKVLSTMLQNGDLPAIAFARPDKRPIGVAATAGARSVGVDMSATASIPGGRHGAAPVSPCEKGRN
jgi:Flp pilus assembly pilin Flp